MHPHLVGESKQQHCAELIKALDDCHAKGFMHKLTGGCNGIKHDLNMCLRTERLKRTANHIQGAKEQNKKKQQIWKQIDEQS